MHISKSFASGKNNLVAASAGAVSEFNERKQAFCEVLVSFGDFSWRQYESCLGTRNE